MNRILIVGGNAGGMTAAGRAIRINPDLEITVLEQGPHVSYSICGAPYYISGDVPDPNKLLSYTPESFEKKRGVRAHHFDYGRRARDYYCLKLEDWDRAILWDFLLI